MRVLPSPWMSLSSFPAFLVMGSGDVTFGVGLALEPPSRAPVGRAGAPRQALHRTVVKSDRGALITQTPESTHQLLNYGLCSTEVFLGGKTLLRFTFSLCVI